MPEPEANEEREVFYFVMGYGKKDINLTRLDKKLFRDEFTADLLVDNQQI